VQAIGRQPQRAPDSAALHYERHRPEQTTLYRLVQQRAASFIVHTEATAAPSCLDSSRTSSTPTSSAAAEATLRTDSARRRRSRGNPGGPRYLVGGKLSYPDLSLFQLIEGLKYAFPQAAECTLARTPRIVELHDRVAEQARVAAYRRSERRIAFNEEGIFRRYRELFLA
jgi:hypothetical protein